MQGPNRTATTPRNQLTPDTIKKKKQQLDKSAFFIFVEEFKVDNKENIPQHMSIDAIAKECRYIWKSMSHSEKRDYIAKARTAEHEIAIKQRHDNLKETAVEKSSSSSSLNTQDDVKKEASS